MTLPARRKWLSLQTKVGECALEEFTEGSGIEGQYMSLSLYNA
jgi:hypothetical protein